MGQIYSQYSCFVSENWFTCIILFNRLFIIHENNL